MDRYIESLLPQDLLLEMDADDQNRYVQVYGINSLRKSNSDFRVEAIEGSALTSKYPRNYKFS